MSQRLQTVLLILGIAAALLFIYSAGRETGHLCPPHYGKETKLSGCELNAPCTTRGEICYWDQTTNSGLLFCDLSDPCNKHLTTTCISGYYCEEGHIEGCSLRCDAERHKYE